MGRPTTPNPHQTNNTPNFCSFSTISVPPPPVTSKVKRPFTRTAFHADSYRNAGTTISTSKTLSSRTDDRSLSPTSASGLSTKMSGSLLSQQLDSRREDWSSLESRSRHDHSDYYTSSDSGTSFSGIIQREMSELREQIRELQAQLFR
ncbi:hypothetical protein PM082_007839 [Marasmius tenuissimus]|nr:hypothetical protein PM082_007839 [Marasmius tenuissimus]